MIRSDRTSIRPRQRPDGHPVSVWGDDLPATSNQASQKLRPQILSLTPTIRKASAFSGQGLVGVGQNVTCSLPGYKYQIAPLARGYTCAVADCTFILAKGVFLSAISTIVFFGTTRPASGFRYTKPPRPALPGGGGVVSKLHQEQHPRLGLDGYGFRILCGAPNPKQVAWGIFRFC